MTHDLMHGHWKEKAAVEPSEESIWCFLKVPDEGQNSWLFKEDRQMDISWYIVQ